MKKDLVELVLAIACGLFFVTVLVLISLSGCKPAPKARASNTTQVDCGTSQFTIKKLPDGAWQVICLEDELTAL